MEIPAAMIAAVIAAVFQFTNALRGDSQQSVTCPEARDIFVGNTYYAIAIFGMKIGSGQTSVKSWKNELVTPCCHTNYILVIARYEPRLECRLWVSGKHVTPNLVTVV